MPNESDTASVGEEQQERRAESGGEDASNGFDSAAAQYSAIHEAHLAHEDMLRELRAEVEEQRERLAEIRSSGDSGGGGGQRMDAVLLRISELERKIGEGAPDPLLNEIVHRLAALEEGETSGRSARVQEVAAEVEDLKKELAARSGDSRADDLALRLASLESAVKRSDSEEAADRLNAQIEELEQRFQERQSSETEALREQIEALGRRLDEEAKSVESQSDPRLEEAIARIDKLEDVGPPAGERIAALEQRVQAVQSVDPDELQSRFEELDRKLEALPDGDGLSSLSEQVRALESRLEDLADPEAREGMRTRVEELETRLEERAPDARVEELEGRLAELERETREQGATASNLPEEAARRLEAIEDKLDFWSSLGGRVAELEARQEQDSENGRLDGFDRRLDALERRREEGEGEDASASAAAQQLETRLDALTRVGGELDLMAERIDRVEENRADPTAFESQISQLREAVDSAQGGADPRVDELREKLEQLEARLVDGESSNRLDDAGPRLSALEEKLRSLDELEDLTRRLTVLEMSPQTDDARRFEELSRKVSSLESGGGDEALSEELAELKSRLAALEDRPAGAPDGSDAAVSELLERLNALEEQQAATGVDAAATRELFDRVEAIERGGGAAGGGSDPRVSEVLGRLESLEKSLDQAVPADTAPSDDPRVAELVARVKTLETARDEPSEAPHAELAELRARIEAIETTPAADGSASLTAEVGARLQQLERRLEQGAGGDEGGEDLKTLLEKESEHWNQWARNTVSEVRDLRKQLDAVKSKKQEAGAGAAGGLSEKSLESVGAAISSSLNKAEVKALRSQMYFVYFTIGMLWALGLYFLFSFMASE